MNPSRHGSDEQMFGAKQQVLRRGLASVSMWHLSFALFCGLIEKP
jgi:hypothetical protein